MQVDLILENANVVTVDEQRPHAAAIAIAGERVVAVGDRAELADLTARRRVDLGGATVVPGFDDAHNHMALFGEAITQLDLSTPPVRSVRDIMDLVAQRASELPPGAWIVGFGHDDNKLVERRHPRLDELDLVAPRHPVMLQHTSGHMSVVNSVVMAAGGIETWPVPTGGVVERDADGRLTGLLQEQAQQFVLDQRLPDAVDHMAGALAAASDHYLTEGITSCQEAGIGTGLVGRSPRQLAAFQQALDAGRLRVRVTAMVALESLHRLGGHADDPKGIGLDLGLRTGLGDDRLRVGAVKIFADGSLIGRTAAMFDDFADAPGNRGYFQMEEVALREAIIGAHLAGWQVAVHAIGDRAVSVVLDCYEEALRIAPRPNHRHRIEHCGICRPDDVVRMAALGVIPVPQGRFVNEIGDGMAAALGPERTAWCYRQRSFLDAGLVVPGSSDRPVVQGAPLLGIADMVNQRTASGAAFNAAEALSPLEALRAYTLGSAVASFAEDRKGSITAGKLADLAVLDRDICAVDPEGIAETRVLATYVGGEAVWERPTT